MALWESKDEGEHWTRKRLLTSGSQRNHAYAKKDLWLRTRIFMRSGRMEMRTAFLPPICISQIKKETGYGSCHTDMTSDFEKPIKTR
jgi:hypothetical protein